MIEFRPLEISDCATIASWVDRDDSIKVGMRLPPEMGAIDVECALLAAIGAQDSCWFVAERNGKIVGMIGASHFDQLNNAAVVHQCVSPDHRYGKTAAKMLRDGIKFSREKLGIKNLIAYVPRTISDGNGHTAPHPALRLDLAAGFESQDLEVLILRGSDAPLAEDSDDGVGPIQ